MNVYQKLNAARSAFHSKPLKKSGHNKFAGYDYFELGDFVIPALSVFAEHGLTSVISFGDVASMTIVNNDKPEETIVITSPMSEANLKGCHAVQNLGAVQTYLRRYLWVAALEIVEHDALDATTGIGQPKEVKKMGGLSGIGDDLSQDWKDYLQDLAKTVSELVEKGDLDGANFARHQEPLDDTQTLYMERFLSSGVRSALRKHSQTKG